MIICEGLELSKSDLNPFNDKKQFWFYSSLFRHCCINQNREDNHGSFCLLSSLEYYESKWKKKKEEPVFVFSFFRFFVFSFFRFFSSAFSFSFQVRVLSHTLLFWKRTSITSPPSAFHPYLSVALCVQDKTHKNTDGQGEGSEETDRQLFLLILESITSNTFSPFRIGRVFYPKHTEIGTCSLFLSRDANMWTNILVFSSSV